MRLVPTEDRVLVKHDEADEKVGYLFIPERAKKQPSIATVVEVGPGLEGRPISVKKGDRVLVPDKFAGNVVQWKGEDYRVIREGDLLGVVES